MIDSRKGTNATDTVNHETVLTVESAQCYKCLYLICKGIMFENRIRYGTYSTGWDVQLMHTFILNVGDLKRS